MSASSPIQKIARKGLLLALMLTGLVLPGYAEKIARVAWDPPNSAYNKFILEFDQVPRYNVVAANLASANYFYIDLYGMEQNYKRNLVNIDNDPYLKYVDALSFPDSKVLRFVFYVKQPDTKFEIQTLSNPPSLLVYTMKSGSAAPTNGVSVANSENPASLIQRENKATTAGISTQVGFEIPKIPQPNRNLARQHSRGKKYIIIDPGHGGGNGGAKSNIALGGRIINEKELTIKFAYELKKLIDASPNQNMVGLLTRVDDSNIGLYDRVKMAEENRGNSGSLFISIHMNDAPSNSAARGMEVYFLNQKGTVDAAVREREEKENQDFGLTSSSNSKSILSTMMTDLEQAKLEDWQYESYIFCRRLEQSMLNSPYFRRYNRGVKNAGFVVLKNFEMPAVLLEVGFISNAEELKNLTDPQFQQMTAALIYNAINAYFRENDESFVPDYIKVSEMIR